MEKIFQSVPGYMKTIVGAMAERLRKAGDVIRRLESNTIRDDEGVAVKEEELSASDVLAVANETPSTAETSGAVGDPGDDGSKRD
jgi:hypothetical protein